MSHMTSPTQSETHRSSLRCAWVLVALACLLVAAAVLLPAAHERSCFYYGCNSGLLKTESSRLGYIYRRYIGQTQMSQAIEKYLGAQPAETHWELVHLSAPDSAEGSFSSAYEDVFLAGENLAMLLEADPGLRDGFGPIRCEMQTEARRACLTEFRSALKGKKAQQAACEYGDAVRRAVRFLDRPVEVSDIPTAAQVADEKVWQAVWEPRIAQAYQQWLKKYPSGTQPETE